MTWTINTLLKLAILAFVPLCYSRPSLLDGDDDAGYFLDQESPRRLYVPVEVPFDALLGALRAHTQSAHQPNAALDKRAASEIMGSILPKMDDDADLRGMKRKMFWQPLGYLPASVRAHNSPAGSTGSENQASSSNVFRYG